MRRGVPMHWNCTGTYLTCTDPVLGPRRAPSLQQGVPTPVQMKRDGLQRPHVHRIGDAFSRSGYSSAWIPPQRACRHFAPTRPRDDSGVASIAMQHRRRPKVAGRPTEDTNGGKYERGRLAAITQAPTPHMRTVKRSDRAGRPLQHKNAPRGASVQDTYEGGAYVSRGLVSAKR